MAILKDTLIQGACRVIGDAYMSLITASSFKKEGSNSSYVLLGDGSHKLITELSVGGINGYTFKTLSSSGDSGWTTGTTDSKIIPTMSFIAYWNGAYSGSSSNLKYCNQGTFGTACTHAHGDYLTSVGFSNGKFTWKKGASDQTAFNIEYVESNKDGSWRDGRDKTLVKNNNTSTQDVYIPIIGTYSKEGFWSQGTHGNENDYFFVFGSNTNYALTSSTTGYNYTYRVRIKGPTSTELNANTSKTLAFTSDIPTLGGLMGSSSIGTSSKPIYWTGSAFSNITHTIESDVPLNAVFTDTWKAANTSQEGYVPKLALNSTNTIATQSSEYVLTYISGTETAPVWRKLPANAFKNDNTWKLASSSQEGYVPAATAGKFLHANSSGVLEWVNDNNTWTAADLNNAGYVPKSVKGKFLHAKSDTGALEWVDDNNTWRAANTSQNGYVPQLAADGGTIASSDTAYVLAYKSGVSGTTTPTWILLPANAYKNDNTWTQWVAATSTTNGTAGYMPAASKDNYLKFLRGDGTWVAMPNTSSFITSSALDPYFKKDGSITATGKFTLLANQYTDDGSTGALDLGNSNILGVNSIYFADSTDPTEGLHFKRSTGTNVDTLYCESGVLKVAQNRELGSGSSATGATKKTVAFTSDIETSYSKGVRDPDYHTGLSRRTSMNLTFDDGALRYFCETSSCTAGYPLGSTGSRMDAHVIHMAWDTGSWDALMALPNSNSHSMQWRVRANKDNWENWRIVLDNENYLSYLTSLNLSSINGINQSPVYRDNINCTTTQYHENNGSQLNISVCGGWSSLSDRKIPGYWLGSDSITNLYYSGYTNNSSYAYPITSIPVAKDIIILTSTDKYLLLLIDFINLPVGSYHILSRNHSGGFSLRFIQIAGTQNLFTLHVIDGSGNYYKALTANQIDGGSYTADYVWQKVYLPGGTNSAIATIAKTSDNKELTTTTYFFNDAYVNFILTKISNGNFLIWFYDH